MAECLILGVGGGASGSDDVTASAAQVLAPYTAITSDSDGEPKEGTIPTKEAATYNTSTADQTINSGQYLGGNQTIKAVTTANIDAGNIKKGVTVKVGDANNAGRIKDITGTYTTVSSGQAAVTAAALRKGYSGFANGGAEVKGNMTEKGAATYYATTSEQTIAAGQYLTGAQKIGKLSQTNLSPDNVRNGVSIYINNGNANVFSTTGTLKPYGILRFPAKMSSSTQRSFRSQNSGVLNCYYIEFVASELGANFVPIVISGTANVSVSGGDGSTIWQDQWNFGYARDAGYREGFPYSSVTFTKGHIILPVPNPKQAWGLVIAGYYE